MSGDFERTFDDGAIDYEKSRPSYVQEIYDDIFCYHRIGPDSRVLEIGMGTGKATKPILDTGCRFIGIEPGKHLARLAQKKFGKHESFTIHNQILQNFIFPDETFDLVYAATAFHWLPEEYGYTRVHRLLKSGGAFARFAYHAGPDQRRKALTCEMQELYGKYMRREDRPAGFGDADAKKLADKALAYGFVDAKYRLYHTTKDFTAQEYLSLLRTYPDHMELEPADRKKLFDGIFQAIVDNGGTITVYYTMDLELARK